MNLYELDIRDGHLGYGAALNEMKAQHGGNDKAFGEAVKAAGLDVWPENVPSQAGTVEIKRDVRSAAMWAASLTPSELASYEAEKKKPSRQFIRGREGIAAAMRAVAGDKK